MRHGGGDFLGQARQDALACALAQRHGLDCGLHHVLGPAEGIGQQGLLRHGPGEGGGQGKGDGIARPLARQRREFTDLRAAGRIGCMLVAQPVGQRAAHLLGLQAHLAGLARGQDPVVELLQALCVAAMPGGQGLGDDGHVAARLGQVQLLHQPAGGLRLRGDLRGMDGSLQPFGVGKAADGQRRRGQPHQLQQRGRCDVQRRFSGRVHGGVHARAHVRGGGCGRRWSHVPHRHRPRARRGVRPR